MKMFRSSVCVCLCVGLLSIAARAQERIVIEKSGSSAASFDFSGFSAGAGEGAAFFASLRENLTLPTFFSEGPPSSADYRVVGDARVDGGRLHATVQVLNRQGGGRAFGKRYRVATGRADDLARAVADDVVTELTGRPGISSKRIAFVGTRPGTKGKEVYAMYPDGKGLIQLTRDGSLVIAPTWSPDGESLLYTSYHRGFPDVYRHQLSPARRTIISNSSGMNTGGEISPDGRHVALILSKTGKPELYVKDLRSGALTRLTDTGMSAKSSPSWSPDGRRIVFTSGHQGRPHLYVISRSGGGMQRITRGGGEHLSADWGDNGLIVFTRRQGGVYRVAVLNPDTGDVGYVSPADADFEDPSWAPDGYHIVASRSRRGQSSLYLLDREGKGSKMILHGQGSWYMPNWSP